MHFVLAEVLA
jgi:hypothetical protein